MDSRRFTVALSFPGEHREFISQVANILAENFGQSKILYDKYHEAEFARPNLDVHLPNLYQAESVLIAIFLCDEYKKKRWCRLEWRALRQLISTADEDRIMFLSFDEVGAIPEIGIYDGDGYVSIGKRSPAEIAELILTRCGSSPKEELPHTGIHADISRIVKYAPAELIGREAELKLLDDAWNEVARGEGKRPHVLTFVALGGEGKTSLVAKWAAELAAQDWPGCDAVFAWSFYSQGTRDQLAASSDLFLKEALNFFGDDADKEFAASNAGAFEKGQRLARIVGQRRCVLILDGLEPLQYAPTSPTAGELKDGGLAALLKGLATTSRGLCVVTTRYSVSDLKAFKDKTVFEKELTRLSRTAGVNLLQSLDVAGTQLRNVRFRNELVNEYEKLVEDVNGHALTLNLLGTYLRDAHGGDIRKRDLVKLSEADAEEQGGHAFRVMEAYERAFEKEGVKGARALAILRLLGLFDRPMTYDCFAALLQEPAIAGLTDPLMSLTDGQLNIALTRLQSAKLITVNRDPSGLVSTDAHPLLREYFAKRLRETKTESWRAAHRRLYEYLCATTKEGDEPTLEELQPLYQAVAHGCHAGLPQKACNEVYFARITKENKHYSWRKLGSFGSDLGAIACFFELPWSRVSPSLSVSYQAWLLHQAGLYLRALGRLTEAIEPMRAALEMRINQENWGESARDASNLSELELTLGEVAGGVGDAEQSVAYADRSGDAFLRMGFRTTYADALHQAGRRAEALENFREAEQKQAERQPDYPLLYSMQGFRYCDMVLTEPERAAWRQTLESGPRSQEPEGMNACRAVTERAAQTLKLAKDHGLSLLSVALDHLTLGRATLYEAILSGSSLVSCHSSLAEAISGLRRAGTQDTLPSGLLTRAWLRFLTGAHTGPESAQEDLNEAWEIAERGPMRLFMADIHLYRARLFHGVEPYPWNQNPDGSARGPKDDLAAAEKLINECGYHRRDEELADAKQAATNW